MTTPILDLAWGHPSFMREYWESRESVTVMNYDNGIDYSFLPCISELDYSIRELHTNQDNAVTYGKKIVVGNGATQILKAIIHSLGEPVYAQAPYYGRFPTITNFAGSVFWPESTLTKPAMLTEIITMPNNPDGEIKKPILLPDSSKRIYDLSYNWRQYGPVSRGMNEDIMVFSLSKATGHAGTRIGWAILSDLELAEKVNRYINLDTCGVSVESQSKAVDLINDQINLPIKKQCFYYGRYELKYRWAKLKQALAGYDNIELQNRLGMFAVFKVTNQLKADQWFAETFGVKGIPGSVMGYDDTYMRLNLGCDPSDFDELIRRLEKKDE